MSNATGNLLITGKVIEDDNFKTLVALQDVLVAGIGIKNLMQQAGKLDFKTAIQKLKSQTLEIKESLWEQARQHLTLWEQIKASPQVFKKIPEKVKTQIENLSEILKKEHRRLRNYELKPIKGALFSGIGLELKKILSDEAYTKLQSLKLGDELEKALYQDLKGNQSLRKAFHEKPNSLEAWFVLSSDKSLRKSVADISKMQKYLDEPYAPLNEIDLNKVKRAFAQAEDKQKFLKGQMTIKGGFSPPDFNLIIQRYNNKTGLKDIDGKDIYVRDIGLGYSGVMSTDGVAVFHLTLDLKALSIKTGINPPTLKRQIELSLEGIKVHDRNSSHKRLQQGAFGLNSDDFYQLSLSEREKMPVLWGFALNLKRGQTDKIEVGFVSGQANGMRNNGQQNYIPGNPNQPRKVNTLNRTDQKKIIQYLKNYFGERLILKESDTYLDSKGKVLIKTYY